MQSIGTLAVKSVSKFAFGALTIAGISALNSVITVGKSVVDSNVYVASKVEPYVNKAVGKSVNATKYETSSWITWLLRLVVPLTFGALIFFLFNVLKDMKLATCIAIVGCNNQFIS